MRHSELEFFKDILEKRKRQIETNINGFKMEMNGLQELEINDEGDYASVSNDNMVENAIGTQQEEELAEIELALAKMKDKVFGICEMCECEIGIPRLKVKPHARYCIDCREIAEKKK
ncbi:MAG TPA: RNA polymerase-binding protein DksA [Helicobacteraceae bacterium]|nr:RNA polymerase-binding protein DksA [Helicobacteraceae bacterium]